MKHLLHINESVTTNTYQQLMQDDDLKLNQINDIIQEYFIVSSAMYIELGYCDGDHEGICSITPDKDLTLSFDVNVFNYEIPNGVVETVKAQVKDMIRRSDLSLFIIFRIQNIIEMDKFNEVLERINHVIDYPLDISQRAGYGTTPPSVRLQLIEDNKIVEPHAERILEKYFQ